VASEVDICKLALSHLGDAALVTSISPPDGSAQSYHCAVFYPLARDALQEMHDWGFVMKRVALAQLANLTTEWAYCYAQPADMINTIAIMAPDAGDDVSVSSVQISSWQETPLPSGGIGGYTPQPFQLESAADGTDVIYTNQANAVLRYTARVSDTTKFSPLFTKTLAASLASMLAGPIVKGEAGNAAAARWEMIAFGRDGKSGLFGQAAASDANQRRSTARDRQQVSWIAGR